MTYAALLSAAVLAAAPVPAIEVKRWVAPLPQPLRVLRAFDPPALRWAAGHRGVDLAASVGASVRAAGAGHISYAGLLAGRGVVVIVHGELRTTYEPVTASVKVGQLVELADDIGSLQSGHVPSSPSKAVLHWGLLRGRAYLDPLSLLALIRPVRLLPRWGPLPAAPAKAVAARATRPLPSVPADHRGTRLPIGAGLTLGIAGVVAATTSRRPP